jgi:hypothetical protein
MTAEATTTPVPYQPAEPPVVTLGLWGPPSSGKTTMLAAMEVAATRGGRSFTPDPGDSTAYFTKLRLAMAPPRRFLPERTDVPDNLSVVFGPRRTERPAPADAPFRLRIMDVQGGLTQDEAGQQLTEDHGRFLEFLAASDGILFLVDPRRELNRAQRDASRFFRSMLGRLAHRRGGAGLPPRVAVCVTMLDDEPVLRRVTAAGWVTQDPDPPCQPRVRDRDAQAFFEALCRWPEQGGAAELHETLLATFGAPAISYFVCSSVGFRLYDGRVVRMDVDGDPPSWQNISQAGGGVRLLGAMNPINVLEPIETLVGQTLADRNGAAHVR